MLRGILPCSAPRLRASRGRGRRHLKAFKPDELEQTTSVVELATGTIADGAHPGHPEATRRHIFVGSKVPWYAIDDGLPRHEEF